MINGLVNMQETNQDWVGWDKTISVKRYIKVK